MINQILMKEERIRAITKMYYSNPKVQEALLNFSLNREVIPRYFEGFGKRPDTLQYSSDIMGLVNKGATSFHASEEIWADPLKINSDMSPDELSEIRKSWDLLIDIDSPFLDCSKIAAELVVAALEHHEIKNYGIKFSGSKGFHIIVPGKAFPSEHEGQEMKKMFPEWPRAISQYLMNYIREAYNRKAAEILTNFEAIERRTSLTKDELVEVYCLKCNKPAKKGRVISFVCPICLTNIVRKDMKSSKKTLRCFKEKCIGDMEIKEERDYYFCENCKDPENENLPLNNEKYEDYFKKVEGVSAAKVAAADLVLVASRHLFRMPYSLHEKTALASVVISKQELPDFSPKDANPMTVKIREYLPESQQGEARKLLSSALEWKKGQDSEEEKMIKAKYKGAYDNSEIEKISGVTEDMFPPPIKKLMKGLKEGRKRGLFIIITFLRSLNFTPEYINEKAREWNKKNEIPLKEGYVRSQIEWHLKQRKKILPPNYDNDAFYRDLGLLDKKPETKNPIVEVMRKARKR